MEFLTEGRWADQWITAGFKWTRKELIWYVNGKEIRRRANDFWHSPETINFDSEAFLGCPLLDREEHSVSSKYLYQ